MLGGIVTALLLVLFVTGWAALYHPRRRAELDAAARIPLQAEADARQETSR